MEEKELSKNFEDDLYYQLLEEQEKILETQIACTIEKKQRKKIKNLLIFGTCMSLTGSGICLVVNPFASAILLSESCYFHYLKSNLLQKEVDYKGQIEHYQNYTFLSSGGFMVLTILNLGIKEDLGFFSLSILFFILAEIFKKDYQLIQQIENVKMQKQKILEKHK